MTESDILSALENLSGFHGVCIPQFTFDREYRIDAIVIDIKHRWIRGFEIKTNRADFLRDDKWTHYTKFLSSLSIVCPAGLIDKSEIEKPFGLLWYSNTVPYWKWVKRPRNFQEKRNLAWLWTYISVLEQEFPRMKWELADLRGLLAEKTKKDHD